MKFLANENFPGPSVSFLRDNNVDVRSIAEYNPGISDEQVMEQAINEERIIVTHDSDYGELIYKNGYKPAAGVSISEFMTSNQLTLGKFCLT